MSNDSKYVEIDGYRIPSDKAEEYRAIRAHMIEEATRFFRLFCETVKQEILPDLGVEGLVGYSSTGEDLIDVSLDPFELTAMNASFANHRLKEYILAKNGYSEEEFQQLVNEFNERNSK